jgi:hypothetical protein
MEGHHKPKSHKSKSHKSKHNSSDSSDSSEENCHCKKKSFTLRSLFSIEKKLLDLRATATFANAVLTGNPSPPFISFSAFILSGKGIKVVSTTETDTITTADWQLAFGSTGAPLVAGNFVQTITFAFKKRFSGRPTIIPAIENPTQFDNIIPAPFPHIPGTVQVSLTPRLGNITNAGFSISAAVTGVADTLPHLLELVVSRLQGPPSFHVIVQGPTC